MQALHAMQRDVSNAHHWRVSQVNIVPTTERGVTLVLYASSIIAVMALLVGSWQLGSLIFVLEIWYVLCKRSHGTPPLART